MIKYFGQETEEGTKDEKELALRLTEGIWTRKKIMGEGNQC